MMNSTRIFGKNNLNSLILSLYMFSVFAYYTLEALKIYIYILFIIIGMYAVCKLFFLKFKSRSLLFYFIYVFVSIFIQILNLTISHFSVFIILGPILGYWIYVNKFNTSILKEFFYILCFYILYYYVVNQTFSSIFTGMSSNYVSVIVLPYIILISAIEYKQKESLSLLPFLIAFLIIILSLSRSGILCMLLLLLVSQYKHFLSYSLEKKILILFIFIASCFFYIMYNNDDFLSYIYNMDFVSKFEEKGMSLDGRQYLMEEYLRNINLKTLFTGYNYEKNNLFLRYGFNAHNSYINFHSKIGIFSLVVLLFTMLVMIKIFRRKILIFFLFITFLMRAYTDTFLFVGIYDFLFFFLLNFGIVEIRDNIRDISK